MQAIPEEIIQSLASISDVKISKMPEENFDILELEVNSEDIIDVLKELQNFGFLFLIDITGVHYPHYPGKELASVYHLNNMKTRDRIRIKSYLPIENPQINSATVLYSAANWMERETYDFYGIEYVGHPDLKRILNVDEMDYFPLRKEYPLEDQTREDKDDEMFGRKSLKEY